MRTAKLVAAATALFLLAAIAVRADETRLMRFPDIYNNQIVFTYGSNLWIVSADGGIARQLTTHDGEERYAKFSPDGKYIAFTGEYDGLFNVYVIPSEGGQPRQLTFHPSRDRVLGWHPDGKHVLVLSDRERHAAANSKLYLVSIDGGMPEPLEIPESGFATYSPDGNKIAYNRKLGEFRTWKRYTGGTASDVWIYDLKSHAIKRVTDWVGADLSPMWIGQKIYFNSDRDETLNLFSYDIATDKIEKVTDFSDFDVKFPSEGPGAIVFEKGGYIYVLDTESGKTRKVPIEVRSDLVLTMPSYQNVSDLVESGGLSPSGKRAVLGARGEVFTVPAEHGDIRNITGTPGVREISATWSPDGKWIAYLSDKTGEYEIYIRPQDGTGEETRITSDGNCYRYELNWSPDSKKIMYSDKKLRLFYVDIDEKKPVLVAQSDISEIRQYRWSPDSRWITFGMNSPNYFSSVYIYSVDDGQTHRITDDEFDDFDPVFSPDGKYLYFLSGRSFSPTFSDFEHEYVYKNSLNILLVNLQADSLSPFAPRSDEAEVKEDEKDKSENKDAEEEKSGEETEKSEADTDRTVIDFDGIQQRIVNVPVGAGTYRSLAAAEGKVFYMSSPAIQGDGNGRTELHMYDMKDRKDNTILGGLQAYDLSSDGSKILYIAGKTFGIIDASAKSSNVGDGSLSLDGMEMLIDPHAEWDQMFSEAWRLERDFYYDPNMHGVDWRAMKKHYGSLLPYVSDRSDLTYLIGELIGELSTSHTYVYGGKSPEVKKINVGLLGADYDLPSGSEFYRFRKIYSGENWAKSTRAPLTEPGIDVSEGEYLIAVNGREVRAPANLYSFFENTVGKQVKLTVNDRPSSDGAHEVTVVPVDSDSKLRYLDWVATNRRIVAEATNGRVGYIHVPNTSVSGLNEFSSSFYSEMRKEGLVVDVRYNAGGMIPDMFIERLDRQLLSYWVPREGKLAQTPMAAQVGPKVCIINEYAGSGGDALPYYFRLRKLGPLVGMRTWGGLVGYRRIIPLMDGGTVTVPEIGFLNLEGNWDVENHGVDPDIELDNRPDLVAQGMDPQLQKAIDLVTEQLRKNPPEHPTRPPYPVEK